MGPFSLIYIYLNSLKGHTLSIILNDVPVNTANSIIRDLSKKKSKFIQQNYIYIVKVIEIIIIRMGNFFMYSKMDGFYAGLLVTER